MEYNIDQIKSMSVELLLQGKYVIDLERKCNFQYVSIGNLYSQINEVMELIPQ